MAESIALVGGLVIPPPCDYFEHGLLELVGAIEVDVEGVVQRFKDASDDLICVD